MGERDINDLIREFAEENGLLWGVCAAHALEAPFAQSLREVDTPFTTRNIHARIDPNAMLSGAKSVVVLGLAYGGHIDFEYDEKPRAKLSMMAVGVDYHKTLAALLGELEKRMLECTPFRRRMFVDNGPLFERPLAHRAGIGFYGRNCCIISPYAGSFFNIGCLLTDLALELSTPMPLDLKGCDGCRACVDACPTGALTYGDTPRCDGRKCVSYLTQKRGELSDEQRRDMGAWVFGCDVCQSVCPHNKGKGAAISNIELVCPKLAALVDISDEEFEYRFKDTAMAWRGAQAISRNARVALQNLYNSGSIWER